jgi:hypothetical protein
VGEILILAVFNGRVQSGFQSIWTKTRTRCQLLVVWIKIQFEGSAGSVHFAHPKQVVVDRAWYLASFIRPCEPGQLVRITISTSRSNPNKEREHSQMDTATIIAELEAERDRLDSAIAALQGGRSKTGTSAGRPDGRRRRLSAAARRNIGLAMKKRWAERKKAAA